MHVVVLWIVSHKILITKHIVNMVGLSVAIPLLKDDYRPNKWPQCGLDKNKDRWQLRCCECYREHCGTIPTLYVVTKLNYFLNTVTHVVYANKKWNVFFTNSLMHWKAINILSFINVQCMNFRFSTEIWKQQMCW